MSSASGENPQAKIQPEEQAPLAQQRARLWVYIGLIGLMVWSAALWLLSRTYHSEPNALDRPFATFLALQVIAGIVYLVTLWELRRHTAFSIFVAVIFAGLMMRCCQLPATPIMETDYYRYLWDGALAAHGVSPYEYSPDEVRLPFSKAPENVHALARSSGEVIHRINHPELRTIYPPTAQGPFAVAYWIAPFQILGLRIVWLALDLVCLWLIVRLCHKLKLPRINSAIYWLNPLLVKEIYNSAHMELTLVLPMLAALLVLLHGRTVLSAGWLAVAAGAKVWPVIWLPLMLRYGSKTVRSALAGIAVFGVLLGLMALPILLGRLDSESGFVAYSEQWRMNDSIHMFIGLVMRRINPDWEISGARVVVATIVFISVVIFTWRLKPSGDKSLTAALCGLTTVLFLVSPTQFPWYFMWLLPLLALRPVWSLLGLTVMLPMYYLRFPLKDMQLQSQFDYGWVWLEFAPIWILLAIELSVAIASKLNAKMQN